MSTLAFRCLCPLLALTLTSVGAAQANLFEFELYETLLSGESSMGGASVVERIGDVDGLGRDDVLLASIPTIGLGVEVRVFSSESPSVPLHVLAPTLGTGFRVQEFSLVGGDLVGNASPDVAIGLVVQSLFNSPAPGSVQVFDGPAGSLVRSLSGRGPGDMFGASIAIVGDLDGDGHDELAVGAPGDAFTRIVRGAYLRTGLGPDALYEFNGPAFSFYGEIVAAAGDVDGDGIDDIAIYSRPDNGRVEVRSGATGNVLWTTTGSALGFTVPLFGIAKILAIEGLGDLNADGRSELLLGLPAASTAVVMDGATGLVARVHTYPGWSFGLVVSRAGDLNNDGTPDYLVSAPKEDNPNGAIPSAGSVRAFCGAAGTELITLRGTVAFEAMGVSISDIGRVNEDACDDIAVADTINSTPFAFQSRGRMFVVSGESCGGGSPSNSAPSCEIVSASVAPLESGVFSVEPGQMLSVTLRGMDPDSGDTLTMTASGLPVGATMTPANGGMTLDSVFSWTPSTGGLDSEVTVAFRDAGGLTAVCTFFVRSNTAPVADAGSTVQQQCVAGGNVVQLSALGSTDADGDTLSYLWEVSDAAVTLDDATSPTPSGTFALGSTMATVTVSDDRGGISTADVLVIVEDTIAPSVVCWTDKAMLWPPRHDLVPVEIFVMASDSCGLPAMPLTVTVRSDEEDDAPNRGDGNTTGDVHGSDGHSAPVDVSAVLAFDNSVGANGAWRGTVLLRAERAGNGDGRAYTLDVSAIDTSNNVGVSSCVVVVPRNRRR